MTGRILMQALGLLVVGWGIVGLLVVACTALGL